MNIFMMKNCGYFHKSGNILGVISIHFSAFSKRRTRVTLLSQAKLFQLLQKLQTDKICHSSHARLEFLAHRIRISEIPWDRNSFSLHTGQCKRTGGCYNELVVAFLRTGDGLKGKKIYTC